MKCIMLGIVCVVLFSCAGVNVVEVCGTHGNCSTGWYNSRGDVVTTEHGFDNGEFVTVESQWRYTEEDLVSRESVAFDVVAYHTYGVYRPKVCYGAVSDGDYVTVSTLYGPVRARIVAVESTAFFLNKVLYEGDSGSPVTRRGCVVGVVRARTRRGALVVRVSE